MHLLRVGLRFIVRYIRSMHDAPMRVVLLHVANHAICDYVACGLNHYVRTKFGECAHTHTQAISKARDEAKSTTNPNLHRRMDSVSNLSPVRIQEAFEAFAKRKKS